MTEKSLSAFLNISLADATKIYNKILQGRPALRRLMRESINQGRLRGFTQNIFGRRCSLEQGFYYKGLNYLVQGTGGDLMRYAMINVDRFIVENRLPVKMLLSVHDEIVVTMPKTLVSEIVPKLSTLMCDNKFLPTMPLTADADVGDNWGRGQQPFKDWCTVNGSAA